MPLLLPLLPPVGGLDIGAKDENDIELMNHKIYNNVSWPNISFLYFTIYMPGYFPSLDVHFIITIFDENSRTNAKHINYRVDSSVLIEYL